MTLISVSVPKDVSGGQVTFKVYSAMSRFFHRLHFGFSKDERNTSQRKLIEYIVKKNCAVIFLFP